MTGFLKSWKRLLRSATLTVVPAVALAQSPLPDPCDLNRDGSLTEADKSAAVSMVLNPTTCSSPATGILANGACNAAMVQRVVNAILGGGCRTDTYHPHAATLTWVASTTPNVTYSVYRSEAAGGPYSLIKAGVKILSFFDPNVIAGRTYYYYVTAVDSSGNASVYSNQATAAIPTP
jgi:hypothetical protein